MYPDKFSGLHHDLAGRILATFYQVYNELGSGFLESVYREAMRIALTEDGIRAEAERCLPVYFRGHVAGQFRADLIVEDRIILELKVADQLTKQHEAQLVHYLRSTEIELGFVLSFGESPNARRRILTNDCKKALPKLAKI